MLQTYLDCYKRNDFSTSCFYLQKSTAFANIQKKKIKVTCNFSTEIMLWLFQKQSMHVLQ